MQRAALGRVRRITTPMCRSLGVSLFVLSFAGYAVVPDGLPRKSGTCLSVEVYHASTGVSLITFGIFRA
jgi:hypothetical protein